MTTRILRGHVLDRLAELPDESVHCCVTSPPYFGLRDYGIEPREWDGDPGCEHEWGKARLSSGGLGGCSPKSTLSGGGGQYRTGSKLEAMHDAGRAKQGGFCLHCKRAWLGSLGLEPSPELYIAHLVEVFREVRRVLRKDGTFWLNIGDSYGSGEVGRLLSAFAPRDQRPRPKHAKPKDLLMIPAQLALALRADGWWLRSEIIWAKKAPMPESVTDRPTCAHEKIFLLTKSARYFWDADAVKEDAESGPSDVRRGDGAAYAACSRTYSATHSGAPGGKRNLRNVWLLGPEPFPEAHFAIFPTEIPRRAILAGTSERGVCPKCGAPWARVIVSVKPPEYVGGKAEALRATGAANHRSAMGPKGNGLGVGPSETIGWHATCSCDAGTPAPATVLDPFLGAGTTALVADQLGRGCIGIELNTEYAQMAERRLRDDAGMFAQVGE